MADGARSAEDSPEEDSDLGHTYMSLWLGNLHSCPQYQLFITVVILTQVLHQAGASDRIVIFRNFFLHLRNGNIKEDCKLLLGLESVLFLAQGAKVMLTANLCPEAGLCNGAAGTVQSFLFAED